MNRITKLQSRATDDTVADSHFHNPLRESASDRSSRPARSGWAPSPAPRPLPSPLLLSIWLGLLTGLLELALLYAAKLCFGLAGHECLADQPALSLDDPARKPRSISWMGFGRRRSWSSGPRPGLATGRLFVELPGLPRTPAFVTEALPDCLCRSCRWLRRGGGTIDLDSARAILPVGDHQPSRVANNHLPVCGMEGAADGHWRALGGPGIVAVRAPWNQCFVRRDGHRTRRPSQSVRLPAPDHTQSRAHRGTGSQV